MCSIRRWRRNFRFLVFGLVNNFPIFEPWYCLWTHITLIATIIRVLSAIIRVFSKILCSQRFILCQKQRYVIESLTSWISCLMHSLFTLDKSIPLNVLIRAPDDTSPRAINVLRYTSNEKTSWRTSSQNSRMRLPNALWFSTDGVHSSTMEKFFKEMSGSKFAALIREFLQE